MYKNQYFKNYLNLKDNILYKAYFLLLEIKYKKIKRVKKIFTLNTKETKTY